MAIKTEYVTGDISTKELAKKYGVSHDNMRRRAAKEKWTAQKDTHRRTTATLTAQKAAEKTADIESEIATIKAKTRLTIWRQIEQRVQVDAEELGNADFRRLVQNYCDMTGVDPEQQETSENGVKVVIDV